MSGCLTRTRCFLTPKLLVKAILDTILILCSSVLAGTELKAFDFAQRLARRKRENTPVDKPSLSVGSRAMPAHQACLASEYGPKKDPSHMQWYIYAILPRQGVVGACS